MRNSTDLIAIIVEGHTERAIMEILLEHNALKFSEDDLLEGEIIRARNAKKFAKIEKLRFTEYLILRLKSLIFPKCIKGKYLK